MPPGRLLSNWHFHCAELCEHGAPDRRLEQSYDDAMNALANYLTREDDAQTTVDWLHRILDRDGLRDAITEVLVDARVHPRPRADVPE